MSHINPIIAATLSMPTIRERVSANSTSIDNLNTLIILNLWLVLCFRVLSTPLKKEIKKTTQIVRSLLFLFFFLFFSLLPASFQPSFIEFNKKQSSQCYRKDGSNHWSVCMSVQCKKIKIQFSVKIFWIAKISCKGMNCPQDQRKENDVSCDEFAEWRKIVN